MLTRLNKSGLKATCKYAPFHQLRLQKPITSKKRMKNASLSLFDKEIQSLDGFLQSKTFSACFLFAIHHPILEMCSVFPVQTLLLARKTNSWQSALVRVPHVSLPRSCFVCAARFFFLSILNSQQKQQTSTVRHTGAYFQLKFIAVTSGI